MPSPADPKKPRTPSPEPDDLLDLRDEDTEAAELALDLDGGAPEPIGALDAEDEAAPIDDWLELSHDEPPASLWAEEKVARAHTWADDLEDFATQEELPILPWSLDAELLQLGVVVPCVLDPTAARSVWVRPVVDDARISVTVRVRMLDLRATLEVVQGPAELVRLGRDVIAGRLLIAVG